LEYRYAKIKEQEKSKKKSSTKLFHRNGYEWAPFYPLKPAMKNQSFLFLFLMHFLEIVLSFLGGSTSMKFPASWTQSLVRVSLLQ
jgi:hypothetical protein